MADDALASVTWTVKLARLAEPVGVPVIAPVLAFRDNPLGNAPCMIDQE